MQSQNRVLYSKDAITVNETSSVITPGTSQTELLNNDSKNEVKAKDIKTTKIETEAQK